MMMHLSLSGIMREQLGSSELQYFTRCICTHLTVSIGISIKLHVLFGHVFQTSLFIQVDASPRCCEWKLLSAHFWECKLCDPFKSFGIVISHCNLGLITWLAIEIAFCLNTHKQCDESLLVTPTHLPSWILVTFYGALSCIKFSIAS